MIIRVVVANVKPETLANNLAAYGLDGTAVPAVGFTSRWGTEPAALAILAGVERMDVYRAVVAILSVHGEDAAYVDDGTDAALIYSDGRREAI